MKKKHVFFLFSLAFLMACSSEKNPLCNCIEKSKALNDLSNSILNMEVVTEEKENELHTLRKEIDSICKPFHDMGPEELYEMRNECIDPELIEMNK